MSQSTVPLKVYFAVFGALLVLTFATVQVAYIDLGRFNTVVAMAIAIFKALLVILFFMHVKYSSPLVRVYVSVGFLWLMILLAFVLADYMTRNWQITPPGWAL